MELSRSSTILNIHSFQRHHGHSHESQSSSSYLSILKEMTQVPGSSKLLIILCIALSNLCLSFYAVALTSSLVLSSNTLLSWFQIFSLLTTYATLWSDRQETWNKVRVPILAVFTSSILSMLLGVFILKDAVEKIGNGSMEIQTHHFLAFGTMTFVLQILLHYIIPNTALIYCHSKSSPSCLENQFREIAHFILFLFPSSSKSRIISKMNSIVLLSITVYGAVLLTDLIIEYKNVHSVDAFLGIIVVVIILLVLRPMTVTVGRILLQTAPIEYIPQLDRLLREALTLDGILEFKDEKFWSISHDQLVGSLTVRVRKDADSQLVLARLHHRFSSFVSSLAIQIIKSGTPKFHLSELKESFPCILSPGLSPIIPLMSSHLSKFSSSTPICDSLKTNV